MSPCRMSSMDNGTEATASSGPEEITGNVLETEKKEPAAMAELHPLKSMCGSPNP